MHRVQIAKQVQRNNITSAAPTSVTMPDNCNSTEDKFANRKLDN